MRQIAWATFFLFHFCFSSFAGTKEEELPDREMIRLMELLREWDMIKNLDLMRQLVNLEGTEEGPADETGQKPPRQRTKDRQK